MNGYANWTSGDRAGPITLNESITRARIEQGERALSREGVVVSAGRADRGNVRNPWTTVLNQYRPHFRALAAELGLTPSAASRRSRQTQGQDDEDPFD